MRVLTTALVLGLAMLPSIARAQEPQMLPPVVTTDTIANALTVQNQRDRPVTVYLAHGPFDHRLGQVPAWETAILPLPAWAAKGYARVKLFAHPEGAFGDLATQEFTVRPPGRIAMVVPAEESVDPRDPMTAVIPPEDSANATLTVDNSRDVPVTVLVEHGRFDVRLGQVPAKSRQTLRFPKAVLAPGQSIRIFVEPQGGSDLGSQPLQVKWGDHLGLRVPAR
jgi:hypothetical protein